MRYLHAVRSIVTEDMAQIVAREMAPGVVYPVLSPPVDLRDEPDEFPKSMLKGGVPSLVVSVITGDALSCPCAVLRLTRVSCRELQEVQSRFNERGCH